MAAFEHVQNMYDIALKPRLLRSLIKENVPNEKRPFRNRLDLKHVVTMITTHSLLSECATDSAVDGVKKMEDWKKAVDSWVNRLVMLVSSDMSEKCWAGISLLGVTCQECSSDRFLASYSVWFHKLLSHLQPLAESNLVKVASCNSIADLLMRLGGLPNVKKDGTSHATKLIQPILKMLSDDTSDAVLEGAISLLCTIINIFPSSVHRHYDSAETAITSKFFSGRCNDGMLEKLGYCLAILPKSRGDEDSWSLMMLKILISINGLLNDAFQGLEEDTKTNEAMRVLVPPGKDPPPPLGGQSIAQTEQALKVSEKSLMHIISALMRCCCTMITSSYTFKVTNPMRPLLMLVGRVLKVDGSLLHASYPFLTTMQQELICSELPTLHFYSLELISRIIMAARSQLRPHAPKLAQHLVEYFGRCSMAKLRIKVYATIRMLLMSMESGMTVYVAEEVINNAFIDLNGYHGNEVCFNPYTKSSSASLPQHKPKKRKHETTIMSLTEQSNMVSRKNPTPLPVKIAALEALETLLSVGGSFKSEKWRSNVDRLLITVATDACKEGWGKEQKSIFHQSDLSPTFGDFQLAALRALLASLISPARVRPPYLPHGLALFRRGKQEAGTKLAEFCRQALSTLEVLIHPRALPLNDFTSATSNPFDGVKNRFQENIFSGTQNLNLFPGDTSNGPNDQESEDDELYESWRRVGNESEAPATLLGNTTSDPQKNTSSVETQEVLQTAMDIEETPHLPPKGLIGSTRGSLDTQSGMVASASVASDAMDAEMTTEKYGMTSGGGGGGGEKASERKELASKGSDGGNAGGGKMDATVSSSSGMSKDFVFEVDKELAMDELPDIVDVEPDSDENEEQ